MTSMSCDIITVGGGSAGCALGKAMAEEGARVLVLEAETAFRDRVRGEELMPLGVRDFLWPCATPGSCGTGSWKM